MEIVFTLEKIQETAGTFWEGIGDKRILAFQGGLGAGKTTFIKALCQARGVRDVVSSPTFSLINEYMYDNGKGQEQPIYHLDLYRIRDEEEAVQAGIEDCLYSGAVCLVEWPEKIPGLLPENTLYVSLEPAGRGRRLRW